MMSAKYLTTEENTKLFQEFSDKYIFELFSSDILENDFSEYYSACKRFSRCEIPENPCLNDEEKLLDSLIFKFCVDNCYEFHVQDPRLFFPLIFRADFILLRDDVKMKFYGSICHIFVLNDGVNFILQNIHDLDLIPHVKTDLLKILLSIFNITPRVENHCLVLKHNVKQKKSLPTNFLNINNVRVSACSYKVMFSNNSVNFSHLNLILKLLETRMLTLDGCNLSWKSEGNPIADLPLSFLSMSYCGAAINRLIKENFEILNNSLTELNISGCPVYNETLVLLRNLSITRLSIKNCIKKRGYFIPNLRWNQTPIVNSVECGPPQADIDLLWEEGNLKNTLRQIDVSYIELEERNLQRISELNLIELSIVETNTHLKYNLDVLKNCNMKSTLKVLKIREVELDFQDFSILCNFSLEVLEISFSNVKEVHNFRIFRKKPIVQSLQELTIDLTCNCPSFIFLISLFKLKRFECRLETWYYYNFEAFWKNPNRKYLEVLKLRDGKLSQNDANGIYKLHLKTLRIYPFLFDCKENILKVLSSRTLQKTVTDLGIGGAYEVDGDHLNLMSKFQKLEKLSLKISGVNLNKTLLKHLRQIRSLKSLKLMVYIGLNIEEEAASTLCELCGNIGIRIVLIGLGKKWPITISEAAFHTFITKYKLINSEIPIRLEFSDCTLNRRCAEVFRNFRLRSVVFRSCVLKNFLEAFMEGKVLYSMQDMTLKGVDLDNAEMVVIRKFYLAKLFVITSTEDIRFNTNPIILNSDQLSNSVCVLRFSPYTCMPVENILNTMLSVYECL